MTSCSPRPSEPGGAAARPSSRPTSSLPPARHRPRGCWPPSPPRGGAGGPDGRRCACRSARRAFEVWHPDEATWLLPAGPTPSTSAGPRATCPSPWASKSSAASGLRADYYPWPDRRPVRHRRQLGRPGGRPRPPALLAAGTSGVVGDAFFRRSCGAGRGVRRRGGVRGRGRDARGSGRGSSPPGAAASSPARASSSGWPARRASTLGGAARCWTTRDAALPRRRVRARYGLRGYLAVALRASDGRASGTSASSRRTRLRATPRQLEACRSSPPARGQLERRRHETALRERELELVASRSRVTGRRRGAPADRARPPRRRAAAARGARPPAGARAPQAPATPGAAARLLDGAPEQAALVGELRELARGLHPAGLERGLRARSPRWPPGRRRRALAALPERRLPPVVDATIWFLVAEALRNAHKYAGGAARRRRVAQHGTRPWPRSPTTARGGARGVGGTAARPGRRAGRTGRTAGRREPAGAGTTLTATVPLAPWRDARQPFLEFGHEGDDGRGERKIGEILAGERTTAVSLPRVGAGGRSAADRERLPVSDHTAPATRPRGRPRGPLPFAEVDPADDRREPGDGRLARRPPARLRRLPAEMAALLGDPAGG